MNRIILFFHKFYHFQIILLLYFKIVHRCKCLIMLIMLMLSALWVFRPAEKLPCSHAYVFARDAWSWRASLFPARGNRRLQESRPLTFRSRMRATTHGISRIPLAVQPPPFFSSLFFFLSRSNGNCTAGRVWRGDVAANHPDLRDDPIYHFRRLSSA